MGDQARIPPVETDEQHQQALELVSDLMEKEPDPESQEGRALSSLLKLIREYEDEHYPIPSPDPVEVIEFHMERLNLNQADLHRETGISESHLSEILNRKRNLSKRHIRILSRYFDIPTDHLFDVRSDKVGPEPAAGR